MKHKVNCVAFEEHSPKYIHKPNYNCFHQGYISLLAYNKLGMKESS